MIRQHQRQLNQINGALDALAAFVAMLLAFAIRFYLRDAGAITAPQDGIVASVVTASATEQAAGDGFAEGMKNIGKYIGAGLAVGLAGIGGGIAVAAGAPAAIGATAEDPKSFGKSIIFVALGEGFGLYGLLISILCLMM